MIETVTDLKNLILETIRANGGWMSRQEVATAIGRPGRANPYDIQLLNELVESGDLEKSERPTGPVQRAHVYRAVR
jgi:hypothetical protein